ncbi:MAG: hypothetical protein KA536_11500 [Saprospiraceae bacterium]|nr:hypothetical protein [Saprospiraceae bacterium]
MKDYPNFKQISLEGNDYIFFGVLPLLITNQFIFSDIWNMHPEQFHEIKIYGKLVKTPRWQQAYEKNYSYTGNVN